MHFAKTVVFCDEIREFRTVADVNDSFDEARFAALLDLAGEATAVEMTQRLDEDLTSVDLVLTKAQDTGVLNAQSHILLSIAGTIGATRVFHLAQHLNVLTKSTEPAGLASVVDEVRVALNDLILRLRSLRSDLAS